jgi:hypothetical protein
VVVIFNEKGGMFVSGMGRSSKEDGYDTCAYLLNIE